jgi:hypothetical protein
VAGDGAPPSASDGYLLNSVGRALGKIAEAEADAGRAGALAAEARGAAAGSHCARCMRVGVR